MQSRAKPQPQRRNAALHFKQRSVDTVHFEKNGSILHRVEKCVM